MSTKSNCFMGSAESVDPALDLWTEVPHQALNRPRSGITQSTNGATFDLFPASGAKHLFS